MPSLYADPVSSNIGESCGATPGSCLGCQEKWQDVELIISLWSCVSLESKGTVTAPFFTSQELTYIFSSATQGHPWLVLTHIPPSCLTFLQGTDGPGLTYSFTFYPFILSPSPHPCPKHLTLVFFDHCGRSLLWRLENHHSGALGWLHEPCP